MERWTAPEIRELNVQETAGGSSLMPIECECGCHMGGRTS